MNNYNAVEAKSGGVSVKIQGGSKATAPYQPVLGHETTKVVISNATSSMKPVKIKMDVSGKK